MELTVNILSNFLEKVEMYKIPFYPSKGNKGFDLQYVSLCPINDNRWEVRYYLISNDGVCTYPLDTFEEAFEYAKELILSSKDEIRNYLVANNFECEITHYDYTYQKSFCNSELCLKLFDDSITHFLSKISENHDKNLWY
jgi:hypothetical protein